MDKILKQFKRIYSDNGGSDVDFSEQEGKLRISQAKLIQATQELERASERLNTVAMGVDRPAKQMH